MELRKDRENRGTETSWKFYEWVLWPLDLCGKLASSIIGDFVDSLEMLIVLDFSNIVSLA